MQKMGADSFDEGVGRCLHAFTQERFDACVKRRRQPAT
jgi:hypothetical protein